MKTETVAAVEANSRRSPAFATLRRGRQTAATERAVELLRKGEIVALPTETVYGLAANALDPIAVAKIFEAKERPRFDPLIVHLPDPSWLKKVAHPSAADRRLVSKLTEKFWPGPFTIVLPKRKIVPDIVTGGLDTVAVRISAHPVFAQIARALGKPLAAPSANRFGRISPTTAQHVFDELGERIPLIIDAGPTQHGIESTIITLRDGKIDILRRGPITEEEFVSSGFELVSNRQDADATTSWVAARLRRKSCGSSGFKRESHRQDADATRGAATERSIGFQPMSLVEKVSIRHGARLPHWAQSGATYAVTFRLADSLPETVVEEWQFERREIMLRARQQRRDLTTAECDRLAKLFSEKVDRYLDAAHGHCWLRNERVASLVQNALFNFDDHRYYLFAWCIMPNHVHVIVRPEIGHRLSQILHTWKSFTAKAANRLLGRTGPFWQREYYDHLIRDEDDFRHQFHYVMENPAKAKLRSWKWVGVGPNWSDRQDADATAGAIEERSIGFQPMSLVEPEPISHRQDADATAGAIEERSIGFQPMSLVEPKPISHRQDAPFGPRAQGRLDATKVRAPGQLPSHYAPKTPLLLVTDSATFAQKNNQRVALLAWKPIKKDARFVEVRNLSQKQDLPEAAANLFRYLRELDALGVDLIVAERVPPEGLGAAILDRLRRASGDGGAVD